ncbi:MAG: hypothetical protein AAFO02_23030 [Bacteroidota bacterium]
MRGFFFSSIVLLQTSISIAFANEKLSSDTAYGLTNPTLAINLSSVRDFKPGLQFLDLAQMMRPWHAIKYKKPHSEGLSINQLKNQGYLDPYGWPIKIPPGHDALRSVMNWGNNPVDNQFKIGRYILTYKGKGEVVLNSDAKVIEAKPGKIIFDNEAGKKFFLDIVSTDPDNTGDYIRDISIVKDSNWELYQSGAIFNPKWINLINDVRQIRFLDWIHANNSSVVQWSDRAKLGSAFNFRVPLEYMVQLSNEIGAEPWFTMPHAANEDYIRNFATYVRDHADPNLPIRVEYSNEVWNWQFKQAQWVLQKSIEEWGIESHAAYHAKKAVETALIWNEVFGVEAEDRLIHVLGAHAINSSRSKRLLEARDWQEAEPNNFVSPSTVFDELAITNYFGGMTMRDTEKQADLLQAIKSTDVDAVAFLTERLRDPRYRRSLPELEIEWREHADVAHKYDLKIVAYEGGQHVHHRGKVKHLSKEDQLLLTRFMIEFVQSKEMADLYSESWRIWSEISDGPFMQFGEMTQTSRFGSWGIYESLSAQTIRSQLLNSLNSKEEPWWTGASPNLSYQHGVVLQGTAESNKLLGTTQEDYIIAKQGDDYIVETLGNDGVHGGSGMDKVLLAYSPTEYSFSAKNEGVLAHGPQGTDFYLDIEFLIFSDGTEIDLDQLSLKLDDDQKY